MITEQKVERLMNYVFTGFPELKGKVGVRTVDAPLLLSLGAALMKDNLSTAETTDTRFPDGYLSHGFYEERNAYIDSRLEQDVCKDMDAAARAEVRATLNSNMGMFSGMHVMNWVYQTLAMEPTCVSVSRYWGADGGAHTGVRYITQWHGSIPLDEKLRKFSNGTIGTHSLQGVDGAGDTNVVDIFSRAKVGNFEVMFDYFCVAHEFMHIMLRNNDAKDVKIDHEAACDLFGAMSLVEPFGERAAVPAIRVMNNMRQATRFTDKLHATSPVLSAYLAQDRFPTLTAREAFDEAKRIVTGNAEALHRSSGKPALKLVR